MKTTIVISKQQVRWALSTRSRIYLIITSKAPFVPFDTLSGFMVKYFAFKIAL